MNHSFQDALPAKEAMGSRVLASLKIVRDVADGLDREASGRAGFTGHAVVSTGESRALRALADAVEELLAGMA